MARRIRNIPPDHAYILARLKLAIQALGYSFRDIETTARWGAGQPWAEIDRMVVFGGSYGGYTVLIALERWPEIWRAGVDLFGVANMTTFLKSTNGVIREIFKVEFGDVDKDAAFLKTISISRLTPRD